MRRSIAAELSRPTPPNTPAAVAATSGSAVATSSLRRSIAAELSWPTPPNTARAEAKRRREASRSAAASSTGATAGTEAVDEEAHREQLRAERAAAAAERERAASFNDELGAAIVNALSRVKVDERTVKILSAINVAAEVDRIAMRGARYGFPGWVTIEEGKRGTKRRYLEQRSEAQAKAIEYLAGAKTAGEVAGRTLALLLMAIYAQEDAVANSNRASTPRRRGSCATSSGRAARRSSTPTPIPPRRRQSPTRRSPVHRPTRLTHRSTLPRPTSRPRRTPRPSSELSARAGAGLTTGLALAALRTPKEDRRWLTINPSR